jgi:hypothetical protein
MTREEMAQNLYSAAKRLQSVGAGPEEIGAAFDAVDELRKSCATCQHWIALVVPFGAVVSACQFAHDMPSDGIGYCRPGYAPKETR